MTCIEALLWDSNIITAYLNQEADGCDLPSLHRFIFDAKPGDCKIYASTVSIAEVLPSFLQGKKFTSYQKFAADMESGLTQISPNANIMLMSAKFRDLPYAKLASKNEIVSRKMDVPDAIILATAVMTRDAFNVPLDEFHTYDRGR